MSDIPPQKKHKSFHEAIMENDLEEVKVWLELKIPQEPSLLHALDPYGYSALDRAVQTGDLSMIKLLIDQGVNVNHMDENGMTSVHFAAKIAAKRGCLEALELMVNHGGDIHLKTKMCHEPLYYALESGNRAAAAYLLNAGSDVNAKNSHGRGYLYTVLSSGHTLSGSNTLPGIMAQVQLLIDHGIELSQIESGLEMAIEKGCPEAEQLLKGNLLARREKAALENVTQRSMSESKENAMKAEHRKRPVL